MKNKVIKLFILLLILMIICIFLLMKNSFKSNINNIKLDEKVASFNLKSEDDYIEYFNNIATLLTPNQMKEYLKIDNRFVKAYIDSERFNSETNKYALEILYQNAYSHMMKKIINDNDYAKYPITDNFNIKFNKENRVIKQFDLSEYDINNFSYKNKTFSIQRNWIPDDAYEKYTEDEINYIFEYGAGVYNSDNYNYEFVLDKDGYLDDIVFKGITHLVVEGRTVE